MKGASSHEGHDHPEVAADGEGAVGSKDVGVGEEGHGLGLAADVVEEVGAGAVEVDHFDGNDSGVEREALGLVDDGAYAVADLRKELVCSSLHRVHAAAHPLSLPRHKEKELFK